MSVNHLFGNKKRNSSLLYGVDQAKVTASCSSFQGATSQSNIGNHGDGFPPNKRYKSVAAIECKRVEDPFEDGDDFTEDDLIEIDTLASQALTQDASLKVDVVKSEWNAGLSSPLTNTIQTTNHISQWNVAHNTGQTSTVAFGMCSLNAIWNFMNKEQWVSFSYGLISIWNLQQTYFIK